MRTYGNVNPLGSWGEKEPSVLVVGTRIAITNHGGEGRRYGLTCFGEPYGIIGRYCDFETALYRALGPDPIVMELEQAAAKVVKGLIKRDTVDHKLDALKYSLGPNPCVKHYSRHVEGKW